MKKILEAEPYQWPTPPKTAAEWQAHQDLLKAATPGSERRETLRKKFAVTIVPQIIGGVPCNIVAPQVLTPANRKRLLLHLHHGGFFRVPGERGADEAIVMAGTGGYRVVSIDYRGLPHDPFPAGIDDAMAVWKEVAKLRPPRNIGVIGSSAGGGMALALVQRIKKEGLPLPGTVIAGTPWADLSKTGDSWYVNDGVDAALNTYDGYWEGVAKLYANGRSLKDPLISPVYGSFDNFPPTYLVSGTRDVFLSDIVRVQHQLLEARVPTQLEVLEGQFHGAYLAGNFVDAPESVKLYAHIARFLDRHLGR